MRTKIIRWIFWIIILSALLAAVCICSLAVGPAHIPLKKIFSLILNRNAGTDLSIIMDIRLPRIFLGIAIGGALSVCGAVLQGLFRNPLVEPYSLGISGGAAFGASLGIIFHLGAKWGMLALPACGFIGAILVMVLLYTINVRKGFLKINGLLLTGVMISFISSSLIMLIMAVSRAEDLYGITFWIMGSLQETNWLLIKGALFVSIVGTILVYFFCHDLNALSLGEEEAAHLGVNVERTKRALFLTTSLLTGFSVSITGIIGFVGLVVPHFMRILAGRDHRILIITSFLSGAAFLVLCDTLSRSIISPLELPVGVITGILGGTLFIYALIKKCWN